MGWDEPVRIGTWNLAGRWTPDHEAFLQDLDCDVLLLTEVSERLDLAGYQMHRGEAVMAPRRRWAAVLSRQGLVPMPDPHPASAMATVGDWTYCSSILPWQSCGDQAPWVGARHADKTAAAVDDLVAELPASGLIWGGDWNHALDGREYAGSIAGRGSILRAVEKLGLEAPTTGLAHRIDGLLTIDHIAVPLEVGVLDVQRHVAAVGGAWLSDHDAYTVTTA